MVPGSVIVAFAPNTFVLYLGLAALSVGSALVMPSLSALVSRYTPPGRQGLTQGTLRSLGSLSRTLGPFLGGIAYWKLGSWSPGVFCAVTLCVPVALTLRLPPVPEGDAQAD
jgi:MFS family permease